MSQISLYCLPNEILCQIISSLDLGGIMSFRKTCKKFNDVASDQLLWKSKALASASPAIRIGMLENCDGDWYTCCKEFHQLKKYVYAELSKAHVKYEGWDLLNYIKPLYGFIIPILSRKYALYYTIIILIDLYHEAFQKAKEAQRKTHQMPTDMYYIKIHLAFLMHTYLITKWGHAEAFHHLLPETVLHFTLQWFDYTTFYFEEENQKLYDDLATEVENLLRHTHPLKQVPPENRKEWSINYHKENMWASEDCKEILRAVSQVVYKNGDMIINEDIAFNTLDVQKVYKNDVADYVSILIIYEAVARRCGVKCKLITCNPYLLEWKDNLTDEAYSIDSLDGNLQLRIPFTLPDSTEYLYSPTEHVHYIVKCFKQSDDIQMYRGKLKILTFVDGSSENYNYYNFIPSYCKDYMGRYMKDNYNIKKLDETYLELIKTSLTLRELTGPSEDPAVAVV